MSRPFIAILCLAGCLLIAPASAAEIVTGIVYIDSNSNGQYDAGEPGVDGAGVTDGVQIVETEQDGFYRFELKDDPVLPLRNTRTVAVIWPSGTWPSGAWYRRLDAVKAGDKVNFGLLKEEQKLPFAVVHATDPHDSFRRDFNFLWRQDVGRMGDLVRFAIVTGDLSYMGEQNADKDFADIRQFTRDFPVPLFHTPGNHDIVGIHSTDWRKPTDIHGNGAFTKYLGPIRWSFNYAGAHFFGLDWAKVEPNGSLQLGHPDVAIDWLEADLARLPKGTRIFGFSHQFWTPNPKFLELAKKHKVELLMAGHAHRNMDLTNDGVEYQLTMSLSKILHVKREGHQLVDYCQGYNLAKPGTHVGHCRLFVLPQFEARRGEHSGLADKRIASDKHAMPAVKTAACELEAVIVPETAKRFGVRLACGDSPHSRLAVIVEDNRISAGDLVTTAGRRPDDRNVHLHLLWDNGTLEVRCNKRSYFTQPLPGRGPLTMELFAEEGAVALRQVDLWELEPGTVQQLMEIAQYYVSTYQPERASPYFRAILAKDPQHVDANLGLARWLAGRGQQTEAEKLLLRVLEKQPNHVEALKKTADAQVAAGRRKEAIATLRKLFAAQPENAEAGNQLAWLLSTAPEAELRNGAEAVRISEGVCVRTNRDHPAFLDTAAVALAEVGRFDDAIRTASEALALAEKKNDYDVATEARKHLESLKRREPVRENPAQ